MKLGYIHLLFLASNEIGGVSWCPLLLLDNTASALKSGHFNFISSGRKVEDEGVASVEVLFTCESAIDLELDGGSNG